MAGGLASSRAWALLAMVPSASSMISLAPDSFASGVVREDEFQYYKFRVMPSVPAVKVMLIPIYGDADLLLTFQGPYPSMSNATWVMDEVGVEELLIRRSSDDFCQFEPCHLYMTVSGYETTEYKLIVYNIASPETIAQEHCAPGCAAFDLSDGVCDANCNTTACTYDGGDCLISPSAALCAPGCPSAWINDKSCDEACYNAECKWDGNDCGVPQAAAKGGGGGGGGGGSGGKGGSSAQATFACADGCLPEWIGDGECDESCNVQKCMYDGDDCHHGHHECFTDPRGADYRGTVSRTEKGFVCQAWSEQFPHQHGRTHQNFPSAGLGGHNHCRNPDGEASPYCFTTDPVMRWDYCDVGSPTLSGCDEEEEEDADEDADADDADDEDDEDDEDDGPMAPRPADLAYVPGAGALDAGSADRPAASAAEVLHGAGGAKGLTGPAAVVFLVLLALVIVVAVLQRRERKDRGYVVTSAVDDDDDDYDDGEGEEEFEYSDDEVDEEDASERRRGGGARY